MILHVNDLWKFLLILLTMTKIKSILDPKTNHKVLCMCKTRSNVSRMTSYKPITAVKYQNQTLYPNTITSFNFKDFSF